MANFFKEKLNAHAIKLSDITPELIIQIENSLSFVQKITQKIWGYVFIDYLLVEGWSEKTPFYLFKCEKHGLEIGYPHGHYNHLLCSDCLKEGLTGITNQIKEI